MTRTRSPGRPRLALAASLLALVALVAVAGCSSDDSDVDTGGGSSSSTTSGSSAASGIGGRDWLLQADGTSITVPDGIDITLFVDGTEASGSSGCNSYNASVEIDGSDITFGTVASTMMACAEPEKGEAETAYTTALAEIETFEIDGDTLVLTGGDTTLTYAEMAAVPDPSEELLAGTWSIDSIRIGSGETATITSAIAGTESTLTFAADGTYSAVPACNTVGGEWVLDGTALTLTAPMSTMMACAEPEGADQQEATIVAALPEVASVEVQRGGVTADEAGSMLSLLDADANLVLGLSRQG